jgi:hypothetical protein
MPKQTLREILYNLHGYDPGEIPLLDGQIGEAETAIKELVRERVIGRDDFPGLMTGSAGQARNEIRNQRRAEERQALEEL